MSTANTNNPTASQPGSGTGVFGGPYQVGQGNKLIDRRHPEWRTHQLRWRWLLDSYEGGEAYRQAIYGWDLTGLPIRNLVRHKREYPEPREQNYYGVLGRPPGSDMAAQATNDDYEFRRAMTPIPTFVRDAIHRHKSKIYAQEATREGPPALIEWHKDVDGSGSTLNDWMKDVVAPLLLDFGQLDIILDHPRAPKGVTIETEGDKLSAGLGAVLASYILPENLVWWALDGRGRYTEVVVCEPQEEKGPAYRIWTAKNWTSYDFEGRVLEGPVKHPFGRVPIVRIFDQRRPRAKNVGLPRYESLAEIQRTFYNKDSELNLSDSQQAHPIVQGPEDWASADAQLPFGPGWMAPMKKNISGANDVTYQGFEIIDFPKGAAESIRVNLQALTDRADRCALMTKPAGAAGSTGQTVSQSGVSKRLDSEDGNVYLAEIAAVLARAERQISEMFLVVNGDGVVNPADLDEIKVGYPKDFDLFSPDELAGLIAEWVGLLETAGATPLAETKMLKRLIRLILPGAPEEVYAQLDDEIIRYVVAKAREAGQASELAGAPSSRGGGTPGENVPGTESSPDSINSASLASAGVLVTEVY